MALKAGRDPGNTNRLTLSLGQPRQFQSTKPENQTEIVLAWSSLAKKGSLVTGINSDPGPQVGQCLPLAVHESSSQMLIAKALPQIYSVASGTTKSEGQFCICKTQKKSTKVLGGRLSRPAEKSQRTD